MLDKLCAAIEPDPVRKKRLCFLMSKELARVGMLTNGGLMGNASYRLFENAFYGLMSRAWKAASVEDGRSTTRVGNNSNALAIVPLNKSLNLNKFPTINNWLASPNSPNQRLSYFLRPSRYQDEFHEVRTLGRGGFGQSISNGKHCLDSCALCFVWG